MQAMGIDVYLHEGVSIVQINERYKMSKSRWYCARSVLLAFICLFYLLTPVTNASDNPEPKLVVPIRIYVLHSEDVPELNAEITKTELQYVFDEMNVIWAKAGIEWTIKEIIPKKAMAEKNYLKAADKKSKMDDVGRNRAMVQACNIKKWADDALNLCIVSYMSTDAGGLTFKFKKHLPLVVWSLNIRNNNLKLSPATLAHEFGHALGLPHNTESDIYLMRGGGNNMRRRGKIDKIKLTRREIKFARSNAAKMSGQ